MDVGEFVKGTIEISPALNGSYVVRGRVGSYEIAETVAFSNYTDLLNWLVKEYPAANVHPANSPTPPSEKEK